MLDVLDTVLQCGIIMPKGSKRTRGVPELHNELKKQVNLALTPTGVAGLDLRATDLGISRSELVEQIGRGLLPLALLPSLPFSKRHELPERMSVCFVTKDEEVLYIGPSYELRHLHVDKLQQVDSDSDNIRIVWVECSDSTWLSEIEKATTEFFQPRFQTNQEQLSRESVGERHLESEEANSYLPKKTDSAYGEEVTIPIHFPLSVLRRLIASKETAIVESLNAHTESIKKKIYEKKESDTTISVKELTEENHELASGSPKSDFEEQPSASLQRSYRKHSQLSIANGEEYKFILVSSHQDVSHQDVSKEFLRELQNTLQSSLDLLGGLQIIKYGETLEIIVIDSRRGNQEDQWYEHTGSAPSGVSSLRAESEPKEIQDISDKSFTKLRNDLQKLLNQLKELQNI